MTGDNPINELLSAPLRLDWPIDRLAEEVLRAIAVRGSEEAQKLTLDAEATSDRQSRRLLRPLLACLATKSRRICGREIGASSDPSRSGRQRGGAFRATSLIWRSRGSGQVLFHRRQKRPLSQDRPVCSWARRRSMRAAHGSPP